MILIAGATGQLGGRVATALIERGEQVRVLVRPGSTYDDLVAAGAQAVTGDLKDVESLRVACAGVDAVLTTANSTARSGPDTVESVDLGGNLSLVEAAEAAGVRRFVFVSALGAHPEHPMPFLRAKGTVERRLRDSGMAWTVLQPNVFMDRLIPIVVGERALSGQPVTLVGNGHRRHSFVAMGDVARYCIATLNHAEAIRQTIVVAGPEPVSWRDVVTAFEHELDRAVPVHTVPPGEPAPGLPDFVTGLLTTLDAYDSPIDMSQVSSTYEVTPTHLTDFVRSFVLAGRHRVAG